MPSVHGPIFVVVKIGSCALTFAPIKNRSDFSWSSLQQKIGRCALGINVSVSHVVVPMFAPRLRHSKNKLLPCRHKGRILAMQIDCVKARAVSGSVYGDTHYKDMLGSIVRVWYSIPVPDFYAVMHGHRCRKKAF